MLENFSFRTLKARILASGVLLAALLALVLTAQSGCDGSSRSLVLVTVSGLRADHVDAEKAPQWSALASQGLELEDLHTPVPSTVPALASLMTGRSPGAIEAFFGDVTHLPANVPTLAETLRDNGYQTTAFVGEGSVAPTTGLARGFDSFVSPSGALQQALLSTESQRFKPRHSGIFQASDVVEMVGRHLRKQTLQDRFFVWVHLGDLDSLGVVEDAEAAYLEILTRVDRVIGDLEDALVTYGLADRTMLAATSLSGASLGEGGERGHGLRIAESVVRVPAFVKGPGAANTAEALNPDEGPVSLRHLRSALLRGLGLAAPTDGNQNLVLVGTKLPSRQYGWPDLAAVGGSEGWLEVAPEPRWRPRASSASAASGPRALEAAPASYRERLESEGFLPVDAAAMPSDAERADVLGMISEAHTKMATGESDTAIRLLRDAAAAAPQAPGPRSALLMVSSGLPDDLRQNHAEAIDSAVAELRELVGEQPMRRLDLARGLAMIDRCGDSLELVRQLSRDAGEGVRLALASVATSCRSYEQAASLIDEVASTAEKTPYLDEWRGDVLAAAGNAFRAREAYQSAWNAGREDPGLVAKLGDQLAQLGELDTALQHYAKAQELDPSYRYPHERAAEVLLEQGKTGAAAHAIVLSLPDKGDPVRNALSRARALAARELYDAALNELSKGLEQAPGDLRLEIRRARLLTDAGQLDEAASELADLRERAPKDPRVLVESARLAARQGNQNEAIAYLDAAEPLAGPPITRLVRNAAVFRASGADSALAQRAAAFTGQLRPSTTAAQGGEDD